MKVYLKSIGDLRDYFGRDPQEIELPAGVPFQELLATIAQRWGTALPPYLWDPEKRQFRGAVFFVVDKQVVEDMGTPLLDGQEIVLMRALSGG
jgi:molybdopterin converting factor small subunit